VTESVEGGHLLFVPETHGYELLERDGEAPPVGAALELGPSHRRYIVTKVAASPLPQDSRRCAYLQSA
jgi:hypothetical protein